MNTFYLPFLKEMWYPHKIKVKGLLANIAMLAPFWGEKKLPGQLKRSNLFLILDW